MPIAVLGGTFNPIHLGHLYIAKTVLTHFNCSECILIPNGQPPHEKAPISAKHRLKMLELAIEPHENFKIDPRETLREGPSFTVLTLQELRQQYLNESLIFILGDDAFASLESWFMWETLLDYAHLVIIRRFEPPLTKTLQSYLNQHLCHQNQTINNHPSGFIYRLNQPLNPNQSSIIRQTLQSHPRRFLTNSLNFDPNQLPQSVWEYILDHQLYAS
ncbi:MAG TPA: nicotinate-nucleotide adenylyltransferase [Gammaproteobacteria bacterium]|nr:nicotinate-nucleotide adenylyltransferase [Gammaproteobacteria bacterium]